MLVFKTRQSSLRSDMLSFPGCVWMAFPSDFLTLADGYSNVT